MKSVNLKQMRMISIVWGGILIMIVVALTAFGLFYKQQTKAYKEFENLIAEKAEEYAQESALLEEDNFKITLEELKEKNKIENAIINDKICDGYIEVNYKSDYSYTPYIKCGNYKTKGFKE